MVQISALAAAAKTVASQATAFCAARLMGAEERQSLALEALGGTATITALAEEADVSRKFVHQQINIAQQALDEAFASPSAPDDQVLYHLPVTKCWLRQNVLSLLLTCRSSYRGVINHFHDCLDASISLGTIHNIVRDAVAAARVITTQQRLDGIRVGLLDEIFQAQFPVLVGVDAASTYCFMLGQEASRDAVTWGVRLLELQERGFNPEVFIADFGTGLRAGCDLAMPDKPCWGDVFHGLQTVLPVVTALENRAYEAIACCDKLERQAAQHQRRKGRADLKVAGKLRNARPIEKQAVALADDVATLAAWLRDDLFALGGPCYADRCDLFDFVVAELRARAAQCPYRIDPLCTFLDNHRDQLLAFAEKLDHELDALAASFQVSADRLRELLRLQKMSFANPRRWQRETVLRKDLRDRFHDIDKAVQEVANRTVRASSAVENLNSQLRNYFTLRRHLGADYLTLLQFYLNHRRFDRSERPERVGKSPAELLTGQKHTHWLEMLGYGPFSRN